MAEQILNLTLEIIYLLTGEDYMVVKKSVECLTTDSSSHVSEGWSKSQSPIVEPPPPSPVNPRDKKQKILELTSMIIQMLTGKVPVRCQDVTVYLSMEEWEYLEGHKDHYKDIIMENHQPLTPQDESSSRPESCPRLSQNFDVEHSEKEVDDLVIVKVEDTEYKDVIMENHQFVTTQDFPLKLWCCNLPPHCELGCNSDGEHFITLSLPSVLHRRDQPSHPTALKEAPTESQVTKRFTCLECGKFFVSNSKLVKHQTIHIPKKMFSCPKCGKCFKRKIHVIDHLKTHTGEKTYSCPECGKYFKLKKHVIDHLNTHTGEKPYLCPECGKYFSCQSSLNIQQIIHTKEKPFSCPKCEKCFIRQKSLSRHQRKSHKVEKS